MLQFRTDGEQDPNIDTPASKPDVPHVVLRPRRAQPFFGRHPWVFSGAIQRVEGEPRDGDEVVLVTDRGEFVGRGLYNSKSNIHVRLYSWEEATRLDEAFFADRIAAALKLRRTLKLDAADGACRLVFSEADGLSGLIVDRYADWLLVQFTSLALAQRKDSLLAALREQWHPAGMWLRTEKGIRDAEGLEIADGPLEGGTPPRPIVIDEHGLKYGVDVVEGQKTGFFLDQRENRASIAAFAAGARVLDVCCYSGGFSLNAARAGARQVIAVDSSSTALALAEANAERNGLRDKMEFVKSDAFKALEVIRDRGERFDLLILDPPKLARHAKGVPEALRGYHGLNQLAVQCLAPDGILVTCSCTGNVERLQFEEMLAEVARTTNRDLQILSSRGAAPDHPTSVVCRETEYLKCYTCRVR